MAPEQYAGAVVAAGASLKIPGVLETGGSTGGFSRPVEILLRDGRVFSTSIRYEVAETYFVTPSSIQFGEIPWADRGAQVRSISVRSSAPLSIEKVEMDVPWLRVGVRALPDDNYELPVGIDPDTVVAGLIHGRITVHTSDAYRPRFVIPVAAYLNSPIRAVPACIVLREGETRMLRLFSENGEPVAVDVVRPVPSHIEVKQVARGVFQVGLRPGGVAQPNSGLTFRSESGQSVDVQVLASF